MAKFKIGEIAIIIDHLPSGVKEECSVSVLGTECEIISEPFYEDWEIYYNVKFGSEIDLESPDGYWSVQERFLRKKRPPEDARKWFEKNIKIDADQKSRKQILTEIGA